MERKEKKKKTRTEKEKKEGGERERERDRESEREKEREREREKETIYDAWLQYYTFTRPPDLQNKLFISLLSQLAMPCCHMRCYF